MKVANLDRRHFLTTIPAGGAATLAALWKVRESFASSLKEVGAWSRSSDTFSGLREKYSLAPGLTYFNHAAIGTIPRPVQKARQQYLELCETNPWLYIWGGAWEEALAEIREKAAGIFHCKAEEMAVNHNTTEGFNLLAAGLPLGSGDEVVFSSLNHAGASICWKHHGEAKGYSVKSFGFPILDIPRLTTEEILDVYDRHISKKTRMLVFPHIDNIVGLRYPVREIVSLARDKGVEFVAVDGAQAVGMIPVDVARMGVDFYATSPHKWLQSPKGLGLMFLRKELQPLVRPMWVTFGQARWEGTVRIFEDYGTRDWPDIVTLSDAIDFRQALGAEAVEERLKSLWAYFRRRAGDAPRILWRSPNDWERSAGLYAIELEGKKSQELFDVMFTQHGYVFRAFETQGLSSMRISPDVSNTEEEIDRFFEILRSFD